MRPKMTLLEVALGLAAALVQPQLSFILRGLPYLKEEDIRACLSYAADRERKTAST
jgi:hypothetical protein